MSERRRMQNKPMNKMFVLVVAAVLGSAALITYWAVTPTLTDQAESELASSKSVDSPATRGSSRLTMDQVNGVFDRKYDDPKKFRDAARELDQQLLSKLESRRQDRDAQAAFSDGEFVQREHAARARADYDAMKKAGQLSGSMKADFKKHYMNIAKDTAND